MRDMGSWRCLFRAFLLVPFLLVSCGQQETPVSETKSALTVGSGYQYQLIPAYYDYTSDQASMDALVQSAASNGLRGAVIANFGNPGGPGTSWVSQNSNFISGLQSNGIPVLGYVDAVDGRSANYMVAEIQNWKSWYSVDGIFFDDAPRAAQESNSEVPRTLWFTNYVRSTLSSSILPAGPIVVFNWGQDDDLEPYVYCVSQSGAPAYSYVFNTFEGPEVTPSPPTKVVGFDNYSPASWLAAYSPSVFSNLVYAAQDGNIVNDMAKARSNNAGWAYVTDLQSRYWSKLVGYAQTPPTNAWATERSVTNGGPYAYPPPASGHAYSCGAPGLVVQNGDFAHDFNAYPNYGWQPSGRAAPQWDSQNQLAFLGSTSPSMWGLSMITQLVTVPATAHNLSFWFQSDCQGPYNTFILEVEDFHSGSGRNLMSQCVESGWQYASFDISSWAGRDVVLAFYTVNNDGANAVWVDLDDVQIN